MFDWAEHYRFCGWSERKGSEWNKSKTSIDYCNIPPRYCTDFIIINLQLNSSIYLFYLFLATISVYAAKIKENFFNDLQAQQISEHFRVYCSSCTVHPEMSLFFFWKSKHCSSCTVHPEMSLYFGNPISKHWRKTLVRPNSTIDHFRPNN